jgi:NADH:ubiquinone oxidoreductase subunit E
LKETVNLEEDETSPDGKWSLITTSCLGLCGVGPVIVIDDDAYGNVTPEQIKDILAKYID